MDFCRQNFGSGAPLEEKVGYSRMVKVGPFVSIGGTTSVQPDGSVYGKDAYEQTAYVLNKQIALLEQAGSKKEEVIKIKVYTVDPKLGSQITKAYAELFHDIRPLCTVIGISARNRPTQLVEIEMEAVIGAQVAE